MQDDCDHIGARIYARRTFSNGTIHTCVQCLRCLRAIKMPEHNNRPWIRLDEVPAGRAVHVFIEEGQRS